MAIFPLYSNFCAETDEVRLLVAGTANLFSTTMHITLHAHAHQGTETEKETHNTTHVFNVLDHQEVGAAIRDANRARELTGRIW